MNQVETIRDGSYSPQNARLTALFSIVLGIVSFSIFGFLATQENLWRLYAFAAVFLAVALFGLIDLLFIWRGRDLLGTWILIIGGLLAFSSTVFFVEGVGLAFGISTILIVTAVVPVALPARQLITGLALGMIFSAAMILFDVTLTTPRAELSDPTSRLVLIVLLIFVLVFGATLVRRFTSFLLSAKLILTTLIIATLSIVFVAFFVGRVTQTALEKEVGENLKTLAESQSLAVGELLARQINILEVLSLNDLVREQVRAHVESYPEEETEVENLLASRTAVWESADSSTPMMLETLDNLITNEVSKFQIVFPEHTSMTVTDLYGVVIASTSPPPEEYIHKDEEWWISAYNNGFGAIYIGTPFYDDKRELWLINIAVPVRIRRSGGGSLMAGVINSRYDLNRLADVLLASRFGETGQIEILLPEDKRVEVGEDGALLVEESNLIAAEQAVLLEEATTFITALFDEEEHLVSAAPVNTLTNEPVVDLLEWQIIAHQNIDEGLATATEQRRTNTVLGVIVVLVTGMGAGLVGRQLVKPITELTSVAGQVMQGDLNVQAQLVSTDEIGVLAGTFNSMTTQLREAIVNLEARVAERTRALQTSIEVGRELQTILQREELATAVVERIQAAFNYYHVHMYLFDGHRQLVLVGGTGQAGKILLAQKHWLAEDQGLVGRAATTNSVVLVPNVSREGGWLPNPQLPETRAEVAVPIVLGDTVMGVLDVQHNVIDGLAQEDADLLQLIASQVAVTLQNAALLEASQRQAAQEALVNEIGQQIQNTGSMEQALQVAIRELGRATQARKARVMIKTDTQQGNGSLPQAADGIMEKGN